MKRRLRLITLMCILALLGGCGLSDSVLYLQERAEALRGPDTRELDVLETDRPIYTDAEPAVLWGRSQLEGRAREAYDRLSAAIAAYVEMPLKVDADAEELQLVFTALRIDHPEYFWFDGQATFVTSTLAGVALQTECTLTYTLTREELQAAHQQVRQYTAACLASLDGAETDYEKILGVYRYLIDCTDYVSSEADQSLLSVMREHRGTCAGYSRSFQYLMSQLGIPCTLAQGLDADGDSHGWNMVQCGGEWYQLDVTWGDPVDADGSPGDSIQYTYCMITDEEIYQDHTLVSDIPMPVCRATEYNYFIREGLWLRDWDPEVYGAAMVRAAEAGEAWLDVRFGSEAAYRAAVEALFDRQTIWQQLEAVGVETGGHVIYTQKDLFREIDVRLDEE